MFMVLLAKRNLLDPELSICEWI